VRFEKPTKKLEGLKLSYPWPKDKPGLPFDDHGWFGWCHKAVLDVVLPRNSSIIVELGSWLGRSTRFMLEMSPQSTVIAIDHWKGDESIHGVATEEELSKIPRLYDLFLSNCWAFKDRLIPVREDTVAGIFRVRQFLVTPAFIYLDANHTYESVKRDLKAIFDAFPKVCVAGDDYGGKWEGVKTAVDEVARDQGLDVCNIAHAWTMTKPEKTEAINKMLISASRKRQVEMHAEEAKRRRSEEKNKGTT
jgi:hypothetical protein